MSYIYSHLFLELHFGTDSRQRDGFVCSSLSYCVFASFINAPDSVTFYFCIYIV